MKNQFIALLFALLFANEAFGQNCPTPQILLDAYDKDVKHLAILRMEKFNSPDLKLIDIPQHWQDTIWQGLAAIFNSQSVARNAVFDAYCIHQSSWTTPEYDRVINTMYVRIDTTAPWGTNWLNGIIHTGVAGIDTLLIKYGFNEIEPPFLYPTFRINTNQNINMKALTDSISTFNLITLAEPTLSAGDGMRINYATFPDYQKYDFTLGWGDCSSGCTGSYTWTFHVQDACSVTTNSGYLINYPGVPTPSYCNLSQTNATTESEIPFRISLSPNPVHSNLRITDHADNPLNLSYEIMDLNGKMLLNGRFLNHTDLSLSELPAGVYAVKIKSPKGKFKIDRFIKL